MEREEILLEDSMSYEELCSYLQQKYGYVNGDYYLTESCKSPNKEIKRSKDGLEIHHIKEWNEDDLLCVNLSDPNLARRHSYEYQQSHNLCYCNLLEHFILHAKINLLRTERLERYLPDGLQTFIVPKLDNIYDNYNMTPLMIAQHEPIKENYKEYIELYNKWVEDLKKLLK